MTTSTFDPAKYKEAQRRDWSAAAAGWREWWPKLEEGLGSVAERLVELAEVAPGDRVLDVATGIGEPAVTAARKVGPEGRVVATDIAPGMLEIGLARASELGLDNIEFHETDAEELVLAGERFDAVLSRFGLMFFPDLPGALGRIRDVLLPGGRLAAAVWGRPERTPIIAIPLQVVARELELPPPGPGTPGPLALADAEALEAQVRASGFSDVRIERHDAETPWDSVEQFIRFMQAIAAPIQNLLADKTPERRAEVWGAVEQAVAGRAESDGSLRLANEVIYVVGRR
ncbi:MAG TPA: class I SAM-dependent methyltransferase [Gaiellaceae bacterium]|nr:class I SAM-dependent methyltransferase [Gaiellaceae bacterium]